MTFKTHRLRDAIAYALVAGSTAVAGTGVAFAQENDASQATTLDRIQVTGSRITRAEIEGPAPVTVINREQLDISGQPSVAEFLRNQTFNSIGSFAPSSGSSFQSQAQINLRGLGAEYTLVLLDGRRMTSSPITGGSAANLNLIPMAAVERIEVLKDGAGAIYGADAIGGVVNIILRKDFEGLEFTVGKERPHYGGNGSELSEASVVGGISSDRGNITFAVDHTSRGLMYNRDYRSLIPDQFYNAAGYSPYNSVANFAGASGFQSVANCDTFQNSVRLADGTCGFDHMATSANEASVRSDSLLVTGNYDITDDVSFFSRIVTARNRSFGVYAAAPVDNNGQGSLPTIGADNPNNPFGEDGTLYYRFTPLGTRDSVVRDESLDVNFGLQGVNDLFGGANWEIGVTHGRITGTNIGSNYGIGSVLQELIDEGRFNPFDPTDAGTIAVAPLVGHTTLTTSEQRMVMVDGNIGFDLWTSNAGTAGFVTGFEYRDDRMEVIYDAQSAAGNVFGSAGSNTGGERASHSIYAETLIPILSNLSITAAARYDSYNDIGSKTTPRVGIEFRPIESLLVRGSWGKGFRAPTMDDLYGASGTTNVAITEVPGVVGGNDELACEALQAVGIPGYQPYPVNPCSSGGQYQFVTGSNPNLTAEESENWGVGLVFSPSADFSASVDYYSVDLENVITTVPNALALRYGNEGRPGFGVVRGGDIVAPNGAVLPGAPISILSPLFNGAARKVTGVDVDVRYGFDTDIGRFGTNLSWSRQLKNDLQPLPELSVQERAGIFQFPRDRGQLMTTWQAGDIRLAAVANYIGPHRNPTGPNNVGSWTTVDLQTSIALPWNNRIEFGVRNVGDRTPPFRQAYGAPFYEQNLYNIYGRTPYLRFTQSF